MSEPISKFWMVWGVDRNMPRPKHQSKAIARKEAERLSREAPGELFVILAAVDAVVSPVKPPETVKLVRPEPPKDLDNDIPF